MLDPNNTAKADALYMTQVKKEGLFGKAFFGHKTSGAEKRRLKYLWNKALRDANKKDDE